MSKSIILTYLYITIILFIGSWVISKITGKGNLKSRGNSTFFILYFLPIYLSTKLSSYPRLFGKARWRGNYWMGHLDEGTFILIGIFSVVLFFFLSKKIEQWALSKVEKKNLPLFYSAILTLISVSFGSDILTKLLFIWSVALIVYFLRQKKPINQAIFNPPF